MSKIYDLSEQTKDLFESTFAKKGLEQVAKFEFVGKKMKNELYKTAKASDFIQYKNGIDGLTFIDEEIFDKLDQEQAELIAEEAICGVYFDYEKDVLSFNKPDIQTYSGVLAKFTNDKVLQTKEAVKLALESRIQQEKEDKKK